MADYFPCTLHRTAPLDPGATYIFVVHPHGVGTGYAWPCFDTDACGFSHLFLGELAGCSGKGFAATMLVGSANFSLVSWQVDLGKQSAAPMPK